ncbi:MAG: hypothetical protein J6K45_08170 [Clostridia bacterium]|nr:hypothetical protein [Clostridia bacterium]
MKKVVIVLIVAILVVVSVVGFLFWRGSKKKDVATTTEQVEEKQYYGNRGNISQTEKIKFLAQNDEYLVGMMGLPVSNEVTTFSNDDMIRFALNIAVERYSSMLSEKTLHNGTTAYLVELDTVNQITEEFFGIPEVDFDKQTNEYYSRTYKGFLFDENIEKTLYYYPVFMEENSETGNTEIIVDAIFIADDQEKTVIESAKYEGKYNEENVDNTIKFIFNSEGKLISYQYQ